RLLDKQKQLEKEINSLTDRLAHYKSQSLLDQTRQIAGVNLLTARADDLDNQGLRNLADQLKDNLQSGIVVLAAAGDGRVIFVTEITDDLVEQGFHAGDMIARIASITGGGGGGRPDMAQAGGSQPEKVDRALAETENIIRELSN
ncbi:MAG: DHHA1 domain-containing protein, partial [Bacillota bacterium]